MWDFADGGVSINRDPSHSFAQSGSYTVRLSARDNGGATNTYSTVVTVSAEAPPPPPPPPPPNNPPVASFITSCTGLSCSFTNASSDSDGVVASFAWSFGDGGSSSALNPSHAYSAGGTFNVTLTVTDNQGAASSVTQAIAVSAPPRISLSASGYKVKGLQKVSLTWAGATTPNVDVYRNGSRIATPANNAPYVDDINSKGTATYTYKICDAGMANCSADAVVVF
jgi:PKD repeat protein